MAPLDQGDAGGDRLRRTPPREQDNDDALAEMKKSGRIEFITLTSDQKAAWRKALEPVTNEMSSRVGKDTIEEFKKEVGGATH